MERYRAIKKIEAMIPKDLASFLGRFGLSQCHTMIIAEQIHGEEFFNISSKKMQPYLTKPEQDHVLLILTCILDNPVDFLKTYESISDAPPSPKTDNFIMHMDSAILDPSKSDNFTSYIADDETAKAPSGKFPIIEKTADLWGLSHLSISKSSLVYNGNRKLAKQDEKPALPDRPEHLFKDNVTVNKFNQLSKHESFYNVSHDEGVKMLENQQQGSFLIRLSNTQYCTLMVKAQTAVLSVQIAQNNKRLFLYSSNMLSEVSFPDISSLISHFKIYTLPLAEGPMTLSANSSMSEKSSFVLP